LEQQLQLERDACAEELSLRQASERKLAEATHALRVARQAAEAAEGARAVAAAGAAKAADELSAAEERLRVANEHNLQVRPRRLSLNCSDFETLLLLWGLF
jgi:hypothetical protein